MFLRVKGPGAICLKWISPQNLCLGKKKTIDLIMHVCNSSSELEFNDCLDDRKTVKKHVTKKQVGEEGLYLVYISIS